MIVLTVNVTGAKHEHDGNGARVLDPLVVFSAPTSTLSAEEIAETITSAIATAFDGVIKGTHQRINATFAFEELPDAGFYILKFPGSKPNDA